MDCQLRTTWPCASNNTHKKEPILEVQVQVSTAYRHARLEHNKYTTNHSYKSLFCPCSALLMPARTMKLEVQAHELVHTYTQPPPTYTKCYEASYSPDESPTLDSDILDSTSSSDFTLGGGGGAQKKKKKRDVTRDLLHYQDISGLKIIPEPQFHK